MKVYHGDNYDTTELDPKKMNMGNNQEGVGIYFASKLSFAEFYGKKIISIEINPNNFVDSRGIVKIEIPLKKLTKVYLDLWKTDEESMFYMMSDYGIVLEEPEEVTKYHIEDLVKIQADEEVRNLQVMLAETFNVVDFVKAWNKHLFDIHGTVKEDEGIWCVINTNYKVTKENW